MPDDFLQSLYGSMYLLGVAIGVLAVAPLSEKYGRLPVYHTSNVGFILTVLLCSKCTSSTALLALRFASGLCGCSSLVLGGPTIRDVVYAEEKCHNRVLWSLCRLSPLLGYVAAQFGTYVGGTMVMTAHWRDGFQYLGIGVSVCEKVRDDMTDSMDRLSLSAQRPQYSCERHTPQSCKPQYQASRAG